MHVFTNFFDCTARPSVTFSCYTKYRFMFGTANTLSLVVEAQNGKTIFSTPEIVQEDRSHTLDLLHDIPGVQRRQVIVDHAPKLKTT